MIKGMMTCKICGRDFPLVAEEHYIARNIDKEGGQIGIIVVGKEEPELFDAFDCPHCGCQNILQERKRYNIEDDIDEDDLKEEEN